ncbi:PAS domain S-box-containing protein [Paenibacillus barcinonensis]|uniref:Circadian input-output histidine kinase CikA n=2 Tax=Paenibacillus barcinonensis TaxID=198119 RepID=A0A2V4VV11_PAEBA|nr:PAS domain S-box-containing protein [Paenibacillus barcinonensis]
MLRDLVLNFTLILIIVFLVHHYLNQLSNRQELSFTSKVIIGISMSMLGTALYYFSIVLKDGTILNFRSIVYLLAAYYGGGGTAFITYAGLWMFRINVGMWPSIENWEYAMYEGIFVLIITLNFRYIDGFIHRWISGSLLLISAYQLTTLITSYPSTLQSRGILLICQFLCMLLLVLFIYYLNQNHHYRHLVVQKEQEMIKMLRMQPGFTLKFRKANGKFEFLLLEGEMLSQLGMDMQSLEESLQLGTINVLPPEKIQFLKTQFNRAWKGEFFFFEIEHQGRYALVKLGPYVEDEVVKYVIGYGLDITEHRAVRRRVQESEERYRMLERVSANWVAGLDSRGTIVSINQKFLDVLQAGSEQVIGRELGDLLVMEKSECWFAVLKNVLSSGATQETELIFRIGESEELHVRVHLHPLKSSRSKEKIRAVFQDITDQHRRMKADKASQAKSEFLALMSHELRTPLNSITSFSSLLQRTDLTPQQLDYVGKIMISSQSLLTLVKDILDFSKIEAGRFNVEHVPFSLEGVFKRVADQISTAIGHKDIKVIFQTDSDLPLTVLGDPFRLEQVLINLLGNAIKFTDQGYVILHVEVLVLEEKSVEVRFEVQDTGIGISSEQMERLFEPFSQAEPATYRKYGGSGLGLVICYLLITSLGGSMQVESVLGEYSIFSFDLMYELTETEERSFLPTYPLLYAVNDVFIVDSDMRVAENLEQMLRSFGLRPSIYASFQQVLEQVNDDTEAEESTCLLIMLDMDTEQICLDSDWSRLMARLGNTRIRVLGYTRAISEFAVAREQHYSAPQVILSKPITRVGLFEAVLACQDEEVQQLNPMRSDDAQLAQSNRGSILVAEDHEINQIAIRTMLQQLGYEVCVANNGREVLSKLHIQQWKLVFMDLNMPEMNGIEAVKQIRQMRQYDQIPVIALTANGAAKEREEWIMAGMNAVVTKPIDEKQIRAILDAWIGLKGILEIRGVEAEKALKQMDDKPHILQYALTRFSLEYRDFEFKMQTGLRQKNTEFIVRSTHSLVGVAAHLHAVNLLQAVIRLEAMLSVPFSETELNFLLQKVQQEIDCIIESLPW